MVILRKLEHDLWEDFEAIGRKNLRFGFSPEFCSGLVLNSEDYLVKGTGIE